MARLRVGVALLLAEPWSFEIQGLRRALGDNALELIAPHLTLVPPVNIRTSEIEVALAVLRAAAESVNVKSFAVKLGPVTTFAPKTPVITLEAGGPGQDVLQRLRDYVFRSPLERELTWPFHPHITLSNEASDEQITHAVTALSSYSVEVQFDRIHLLQEVQKPAGRVWHSLADAAFGSAVVVGRGGLPLTLTISSLVDPVVRERVLHGRDDNVDSTSLVVTARRDGDPVGVAIGRADGSLLRLLHIEVVEDCRGQGVGAHLVAAFKNHAATGGFVEIRAEHPHPFLARFGL